MIERQRLLILLFRFELVGVDQPGDVLDPHEAVALELLEGLIGSPALEKEADRLGQQYVAAEGWDPELDDD